MSAMGRKRTGCTTFERGLAYSMKIPTSDFDAVDVQIGDVYVPLLEVLFFLDPRIAA